MNVNKLDKIKNKKNIQLVLIIVSIILAAFIVQFTFLITMYKPVASGEISLKLIDYMILFSLYVIPIFIAIVFIVILRRLNFFKCTKKNLLNSLKSGIVFIIGTLIIFLLQFFFENGKIINQAILIVLLFSLVATFFLQITVNFFVLDLLTEKYNIVNNQIYFTIIITSIVYAIFHTFGFTINYEIIIKKNTDFLENNLPFLLINIIGNFCTGFYSCVIFLRTRNIYSTIFYTTI
jgi:membrane protease YdiL (CAAX protease family)